MTDIVRKAIARLESKAVTESDDAWILRGIATTPRTDRVGDVVEPLGGQFDRARLPKLFLYHDTKKPVGSLTSLQPSAKGIPFEARIPKVAEPGVVRDRILEAVHSVMYDLLSFVSIGFRALDAEPIKGGGLRFKAWEMLELSIVGVPAQPDAVITGIKSFDDEIRAALGAQGSRSRGTMPTPLPGAAGQTGNTPTKGKTMKSFAERLQEMQEQRAEKAARIKELATGCDGDFDALAANELEEYRGLGNEVKALDVKINDVKSAMQAIDGATPVDGSGPAQGTTSRSGGTVHRQAKGPELPKGTRFARAVIAMAAGRGSKADAIEIAKTRFRDTPEVVDYIKVDATVGTGANDATTGNWADPLNARRIIDTEFIELLRPATVLGRLTGVRPATFNTQIVVQTGGSTVQWVGNAKAKPVGELAFDFLNIDIAKCAGIIVLSEEQIMTSRPGSEDVVRTDLVNQVSQFLDQQFLDPTVAGSDDNPASITNGVTPVPATGTDADALTTDLYTAMQNFAAANMGVGGVVAVMNSATAMALAMMRNPLGQAVNPNMGVDGGTLNIGVRVLVTDNLPVDTAGGIIVLLKPSEIYVADAGGVRVDTSREATLDMGGGDTPDFNLWQKNCVAFRAERFISWKKRRAAAVQYISGAGYLPVSGT